MTAPCARSSSTCSALPVETRACDARKTTFRIASSASSLSRVRSARNRAKYVEATCVSTARCFCARSAPAIAASASAASVRAPRFPPRGIFWLSWTITGTVEKSTGVFQSWTISIGSSSAPAGETALCAARTRAVAAFRSGFLFLASRRRSARRRGGGAASATDSSTATIASLPLSAAVWVNERDRKSTRLNSSHGYNSYAVFCLKKKKNKHKRTTPSQEHAPTPTSHPTPHRLRHPTQTAVTIQNTRTRLSVLHQLRQGSHYEHA